MFASRTILLAALSFFVTTQAGAQQISPQLESRAAALAADALRSNLGYSIVESLTTEVGPRLAGTEAEQRARQWAVAKLESLGFANVRIEPFALPVWERGVEWAHIISPYPQPLVVTALGGSTSTGPDGVEGELASFSSLQALVDAPREHVAGKIAFVDEVMTRTQDGSGYKVASAKRRKAAYVAEEKGAQAVLIRSVGTNSQRFAHTGQMRRATEGGDSRGVPAAAVSAPDADQLQRILSSNGSVRLRLVLTPEQRPAGTSGNVIAEIPGTKAADEIVLIGAHLDSWDLGTGAVDDGAGVGIVVAAAKQLMDAMPEGPRRTVRVVLFGAEEVGLVGAKAYAEAHAGELAKHVVASESDFGAGRIWRFETGVAENKVKAAQALGTVVRAMGAGPGGNTATGGPDMKYLREAGVPVVGLKQNGWDYFDLHHTPNDTLDKIDPQDMAHNVAAWVSFIFLAANSAETYR